MGSSDGGYLEMDTGAVIEQTAALTGVADRLNADWSGTGAEVDGRRPGIGDDFLGHVFHGVYDPDESAARQLADRVAPALHASAGVAELSAYLYRSADAYGSDAMPAAEGGNHGPR